MEIFQVSRSNQIVGFFLFLRAPTLVFLVVASSYVGNSSGRPKAASVRASVQSGAIPTSNTTIVNSGAAATNNGALCTLRVETIAANTDTAFALTSIPAATPSPVSGKIGFLSSRGVGGFNFAVFTMNPDGSGQTRVSTNDLFEYANFFAWSRDGTQIALEQREPGSQKEIMVVNSDGSGLRTISQGVVNASSPAWSPDGVKVVFSSDNGLYVATVDGSSLVKLTSDSTDGQPVWSPDGVQIAFVRNVNGTLNLFVMKAGGTDQRNLTIGAMPEWSPAGSKILFVRSTGSGFTSDILTMNRDGTNESNLTNHPSHNWRAKWSPDGTRILFDSDRSGSPQICVMNVDGTGLVRLSNNSAQEAFGDWSPDASKIVFESDRDLGGVFKIYLMNSDGSGQLRLTNDGFAVELPRWQPPVTIPLTTPSTIQFNAVSYSVGESEPRLDLTVIRSGDTSGAATVNFATIDDAGSQPCGNNTGIASVRCDYMYSTGALTFAPGETSKIISVPIIDDTYTERDEAFALILSNPSGATLGAQSTATLTITDNDAVSVPNPLDNSDARFFVREHYLDFLARFPDQGGWDFWTNNITNCAPTPSCGEIQHINTSAAFFLSIEFQETGYLVERLYKVAYGDASGNSTFGGAHQLAAPIVRFSEFLPDLQQIGRGLVVGQMGWEILLENNKRAFIFQFVQRSRFTSVFATSMTPAQFVDKLFINAGVTPSVTDRQAAIDEFGSASNTSDVTARARALRDVAENAKLNGQEFNRAFVLMQYFGYLRRNPNDAPDTNYSGYDFWLTKLNAFNGSFVNAEMVKAFITSGEYRQRFGPP